MNRDEALKKSDDALHELAQTLRAGKSEQLLAYLAAVSRFHQYSFGNCMLIYLQKPDATHVAGFHRWKELKRFVKKGEKGIAILAPLVGKRQKETDRDSAAAVSVPSDDNTGKDGKVLYGFRVVHIFDVSQTDGEALPEFAGLNGDPGDRIERLTEIIRSHGISLEFADTILGGANGTSSGGKITIAAHLPKPQMFSTMVHELAHELLHWGDRREATTTTMRETEAEAVAYVVCRAVGLECSTRAADYIQIWNGDEKILMQSLELVRGVATDILSELEANVSGNVSDAA